MVDASGILLIQVIEDASTVESDYVETAMIMILGQRRLSVQSLGVVGAGLRCRKISYM